MWLVLSCMHKNSLSNVWKKATHHLERMYRTHICIYKSMCEMHTNSTWNLVCKPASMHTCCWRTLLAILLYTYYYVQYTLCCHWWTEAIMQQNYCLTWYLLYIMLQIWDMLTLIKFFAVSCWEHKNGTSHVLFFTYLFYFPYTLFLCSFLKRAPCSSSMASFPFSFCTPILFHSLPSCPPFSSPSCLSPHLPYFTVAPSQANNQLINQLSPRIIVAALRGTL